MSDPKVLELSLLTFTSDKLEIKVKNISGSALLRTLTIELYAPKYLVNNEIHKAAIAAATNVKQSGIASLAGVVTGPVGWSVWAKRETSDSSVVILLLNDFTQEGNDLATPVQLAVGAEFNIGIPLDPEAKPGTVNLLYSYLYGREAEDTRVDGMIELKSDDHSKWTPDVKLTTDQRSPTMIAPGTLVTISWEITDGVGATLRGPLPGGNTELALSPNRNADFWIAKGSIQVIVVSSMTYVLQAEVKRSDSQPNVQVVRMLSLDTSNKKYTYVSARPTRVLPYGLIEIDWAAWGVPKVLLSVGDATRVIKLTQQTLGRFYEGSGVMRVNAGKTKSETIQIDAELQESRKKTVQVISWQQMDEPDLHEAPLGLAVIAPNIALLTFMGLYIAPVGDVDKTPALKKLIFTKTDPKRPIIQWAALTAVDQRFVCLCRIDQHSNPDFDFVPFTIDGKPDEIPPVTLPRDVANILLSTGLVLDFVGFGHRAYLVAEISQRYGIVRCAFSVGFDSHTKKADLRSEPLLEALNGYRLVTFDDGLYALNRTSGEMFRFDLTPAGTLDGPFKAASAVTKGEGTGAKEQSMISQGLIVPVGRVLVVLSPSSVPSIDSLQRYGLQNTMSYEKTKLSADPNSIPQDLIYNSQKNYWARCGHDLDIKAKAVAAFRDGDSPRLWVIQPDRQTYTLAVGSETLFAPDYVSTFPTRALSPYFNKKRQFKIKSLGPQLMPLSHTYRRYGIGIPEISRTGSVVISALPTQQVSEFAVELGYNEANPAPITLRLQAAFPGTQSSDDLAYMLELTFSGPDLATVTSCFRRLAQKGVLNDEISGSRLEHSAGKVIEVPLPEQLQAIPLVIANSSRFVLKLVCPNTRDVNFNSTLSTLIDIGPTFPDGKLMIDPMQKENGGELGVSFNFALPPGVEVSSGASPQTKRIRLDSEKKNLMRIKFVRLLKPGDPALKLEGIPRAIEPIKDRIIYVCQIDDTL